jgi:ankyrin repeat protein
MRRCDIEKVKLLIERGADVNARAATGITALMVAARHRGNAEVVRLLLKQGARPNPDKGIEVRNDASALFFAIMAEDTRIIGALLDAGARLDSRMKLIGRIPVNPLFLATVSGDPAVVDCLIARGSRKWMMTIGPGVGDNRQPPGYGSGTAGTGRAGQPRGQLRHDSFAVCRLHLLWRYPSA